MGVIAYQQQDVTAAVELFTNAFAANPLYVPTIKNLAPILEAAGSLTQMEDLVAMAAKNNPQDVKLQALAKKLHCSTRRLQAQKEFHLHCSLIRSK